MGRLVALNYGDPESTPNVGFTYDRPGNRLKMTETGVSGVKVRETHYDYDESRRLSSVSFDTDGDNTFDQVVGYTYDLGGLRTSLTMPGSKTVSYTYNKLRRMITLEAWDAQQTDFAYDAAGRILWAERSNNMDTSYLHYPNGQMKQIRHSNGATTLAQYDYTVDGRGNRTQVHELLMLSASTTEEKTITHLYDTIGRLRETKYYNGATPTGTSDPTFSYTYDLSGNRLSETVGMGGNITAKTFSYNAANQLTGDGTYTYEYDSNGNLTTKKQGTTVIEAPTWDRANRLLTLGSTSNKYDGSGQHIQQTVSSVVTDYLLDVQPPLHQIIAATTGAATTFYVHGPRGVYAQQDSAENWEWMLQDGLGSVRSVIQSNGTVVDTRYYGPYGTPFGLTGTNQTMFGFTGEPTDPNTGLLYLRARHYNPALGTFLSLDPFEGRFDTPMSLNGYSYVHGNPVNLTDPSGENPVVLALGAVLALTVFVGAFAAVTALQRNTRGGNLGQELSDWLHNVCLPTLQNALESTTNPDGTAVSTSSVTLPLRPIYNFSRQIYEYRLAGFGAKVGTLAEHLAKLLERDVAGYPPSDPNPNRDPDGGWCQTIRRVIQEIDNAGYSERQLNRDLEAAGFAGAKWAEIISAVRNVVELGLCDDHWGDFGGGSLTAG